MSAEREVVPDDARQGPHLREARPDDLQQREELFREELTYHQRLQPQVFAAPSSWRKRRDGWSGSSTTWCSRAPRTGCSGPGDTVTYRR